MSGDVLVIFDRVDDKKLEIGLLESDLISNSVNPDSTSVRADNYTRDGVILSKTTGEVDGYHSEPLGKTIPKYRDGKLHSVLFFKRERIGVHKGIPLLAPVFLPLRQLYTYIRSERQGALVSSLFTVFIETPDSLDKQFGEPETNSENPDENKIAMGNGAIMGLNPGEKVSFANPSRPNTSFGAYIEQNVKTICAAIGLPFEIVLKHFASSYSASRAAKLEANKAFDVERRRIWNDVATPIFNTWLDIKLGNAKSNFRGFRYINEIAELMKVNWNGDTYGQIDELKEVNAAQKRIEIGISSVARESMQIGVDFDTSKKKLKDEVEYLKEFLPLYQDKVDDTTPTSLEDDVEEDKPVSKENNKEGKLYE